MDAVAPAIIGIGIYLMYEAFKNTNPTPVAKIKSAITGAAASTVAPLGGAGSANQPSVTVIAPAGQQVPGATVQPS